ncbi:MAG: hypothetical protein OEV28_04595 [Nitrospirota bacterium]|nr:hypothetical protein [Nitrospirota bacterium]
MQIEKAPTLYFKEMVDAAIEHQKVKIDDSVEFYLINLLSNYTNAEKLARFNSEPMVLTLARAAGSSEAEQRSLYKEIGDTSLYVSGFFPDSFNRKVIDVDFYVKVGSMAYGSLANLMMDSRTVFYSIYSEMSGKFKTLVDVLVEVSERCKLTSKGDAMRVYERWLRMKSKNSEEALKELGIIPLYNLDHTIIH